MGHPERMCLSHGLDIARFLEESRTMKPNGEAYRNLCIGCDRFHEKVMGPEIDCLHTERLNAKRATG